MVGPKPPESGMIQSPVPYVESTERFKYALHILGYMTQPVQQSNAGQSPQAQIAATEWADDLILSDEDNTDAWVMCPKEDTVDITR